MKNGLSRFIFYTDQVNTLLLKASADENPAMWLFLNNGRTPFFMLEGLSRIYASMHNSGRFGKLQQQFKQVEDGLGKIDYYNWLLKAFTGKKEIPEDCKQYIKSRLDECAAELNKILVVKSWLPDDSRRMKKISGKLMEADWLKPDEEVKAVTAYYKASITDINEFAAGTAYRFDNVEKDVHELRRRLRWLSIYPQALQGLIQYGAETKPPLHLNKYLTEEIISSPFNKLPPPGKNTAVLTLNKNYFLSLSWMIARLGDLKDEGLVLTGLCEAINKGEVEADKKLLKKAYTILGSGQRKMEEILANAGAITKIYFMEKNLKQLLAVTKKPKLGEKL